MALIAVITTVGGCTSNYEGLLLEQSVPVSLKASVEGVATGQTRATDTQNSEFVADQFIDAYIFLNDGTTPLATGSNPGTNPLKLKVTGTGGDLTAVSSTEPRYYYPTDGSNIKICAVHPSVDSADPFSVETDQTTEANYAKSDLCYSATGSYSRQIGSHTLIFSHVLSKIVVNIVNNYNTSNPSTAVLHANTTTAITYPTGTTPDYTLAAASVPGAITMALSGTGNTVSGEAIIPPQTIAAESPFITFNIIGLGPMIYPLPVATNFASGKKYVYTVTVTQIGLQVTTNITDWDATPAAQSGQGTLNRPKLPIEYIAPYNMQTATSMATDNLISHSMYFCWNTSNNTNTTPKANIQKMINGTAVTGYHLPSKAEWCSIIPPYYADSNNGGSDGIRIVYKRGMSTNLSETVGWGVVNNNTSSTYTTASYSFDVLQTFYNDYNCPNDDIHTYIGYALRFKELSGGNYVNGQYTCAYRYEYKPSSDVVGGTNKASLIIKVIYVGANPNITITTISDESWWTSPEYTVVLPAGGYSPGTNNTDQPASFYSSTTSPQSGFYWTATTANSPSIHRIGFSTPNIDGNGSAPGGYGFYIRLFKDK